MICPIASLIKSDIACPKGTVDPMSSTPPPHTHTPKKNPTQPKEESDGGQVVGSFKINQLRARLTNQMKRSKEKTKEKLQL